MGIISWHLSVPAGPFKFVKGENFPALNYIYIQGFFFFNSQKQNAKLHEAYLSLPGCVSTGYLICTGGYQQRVEAGTQPLRNHIL